MSPTGTVPPTVVNPVKELGDARTLGIVAIVTAFLIPLVCFICGGIGISKANKFITLAQANADPYMLNDAQSARKLNLIGIILGVVLTVLSVIVYILVFAFAFSSAYY